MNRKPEEGPIDVVFNALFEPLHCGLGTKKLFRLFYVFSTLLTIICNSRGPNYILSIIILMYAAWIEKKLPFEETKSVKVEALIFFISNFALLICLRG